MSSSTIRWAVFSAFSALQLLACGSKAVISEPPSPSKTPLAVSITPSVSSSVVRAKTTVAFVATTSGTEGKLRIELYDNGALRSAATSSPTTFDVSLTRAENGLHVWTAKVTDDTGQSATSSAVSLTVDIDPIPAPIFGVTVDDVSQLDEIKSALSHLHRKPSARIVFDYPRPSTDYAAATESLHGVANVMGQLMDSFFLKNTVCPSGIDMAARADDYLGNTVLANNVDVWEIGNEVNGDWLCNGDTGGTYTVIRAAYDKVKAKGYPTALTLFWYDANCTTTDYEMFNWVDGHVEEDMRLGLDYVFISAYEASCPAPVSWTPIFNALATRFPNSKLGFGEVGTGGDVNATLSTRRAILDKYYGLAPMHPRYVGGYFWWTFVEDMVPDTNNSLWNELDTFTQSWSTLYP